jgi:hypothetical protein
MAQSQKKFDGSLSKGMKRNGSEGEENRDRYDGFFGGYHGHSPGQERRLPSLTGGMVEASLNAVKQLSIPSLLGIPGV